jgi:hypothetical protein
MKKRSNGGERAKRRKRKHVFWVVFLRFWNKCEYIWFFLVCNKFCCIWYLFVK